MTFQPFAPTPTASVLSAFSLVDAFVTPITTGRANLHWRLETPGGVVFALRRYNARRSPQAIAWEHVALRHIQRKGWPVSEPIAVGSKTTLEIDGANWSLFPFLPGSVLSPGSVARSALKGRLLARLHNDLTGLEIDDQRDGFGRVWELDQFVGVSGASSFNELLRWFAAEYYDLARGLRTLKYRSLRELARLGYGDLAARPVHCDFHTDNILFDGNGFCGLLDFDSVRLDCAAFDIAASIANDCIREQELTIDIPLAAAFVRGYSEHRPLPETEITLIPALLRAYWLNVATFRLEQWVNGGDAAGTVGSVARMLERRVPALDAVQRELQDGIAATVTA